MTTEITTSLPPCPLPDCEGGEHHFHDVEAYAAEKDKTHDCATHARDGFRCYDPHRPGIPQWQPIEYGQIRAGMRIRVTEARGDRIITRTGVARHTDKYGDWVTDDGWLLTGWSNLVTYEVDSATIPDPDAELIEKIGKAIHDADKVPDEWGDEWGAETYRKLARAALDAVRAHDEAVTGDE